VPPAPEGTLSYTYFPTGKVQTITSSNPNGASVAYTYDDLNRLSTVVDNSLPGNNTTSYTYDPGAPVDRSSSMGWRVAQVPIHKSGWPRSLAFGDLGYHYVSRSTPMTTTAISAHTACFPRSRYSNNYLYRGEQYDSDLGLYYLRARYYNPATGRFLSRDPEDGKTLDPATLHKYLYANGDPVNGIDPRGREDLVEYLLTIKAEKAAIILAVGCGFAIKSALDLLNMSSPTQLNYDSIEGALTACIISSVIALL